MQNSLSENQGMEYIRFLEEIYGKRNVANLVRFEKNVVKFVPKTKVFEYLNKTTLENGYNNKTNELPMQCESCKEFYNFMITS
ncbi:hypothetical protein DSAG12_00822 [Promethearchaeum syntrophicum]|uniref:Uncharacterized protein n=1 Tax=Promethearchaeum syntrophicum TaxID=2594042 RepID=A0A5B9D771_9ARCH|nr:hypothetical protein [Candidatus Prometheoarchaeum syntrophicum]